MVLQVRNRRDRDRLEVVQQVQLLREKRSDREAWEKMPTNGKWC